MILPIPMVVLVEAAVVTVTASSLVEVVVDIMAAVVKSNTPHAMVDVVVDHSILEPTKSELLEEII